MDNVLQRQITSLAQLALGELDQLVIVRQTTLNATVKVFPVAEKVQRFTLTVNRESRQATLSLPLRAVWTCAAPLLGAGETVGQYTDYKAADPKRNADAD